MIVAKGEDRHQQPHYARCEVDFISGRGAASNKNGISEGGRSVGVSGVHANLTSGSLASEQAFISSSFEQGVGRHPARYP